MLSTKASQMASSIEEHYRSLPGKEQDLRLRSIGHEWLECASDGRIRKRLIGWSRELDAQAYSQITSRPVADDELRDMRAAVGALVIFDNPEQVRAVGRKIFAALCDSDGDKAPVLKEMLADLPPDSLKALYIKP